MSTSAQSRRPLETKEDSDPSATEIKKAVSDLATAFEAFKESNDNELKEIKKKGGADVVTAEMTKRINEALTPLQDKVTELGKKTAKIDELEKKAMRPSKTGEVELSAEQIEHKQVFGKFIRKGFEAGLADLEQKATPMTVGSDPAGGYLVPTEMSDRIIKRQFETSPMRQLAYVQSIASGGIELLRETNDFDASWVGEEQSRDDTTNGTFGRIRIDAKELHAQPKVSQALLDDALFDVEGYLAGKIADRFTRKENDGFTNGDGVLQPRGFATYSVATTDDATRADLSFQYVAAGASADFTATTPADKLISLVQKMKAGFLAGSVWLTRRAVYEKVRQFKESTTNAYIWQPGLQVGQPASLLGYAAWNGEDMPALAANSLSMVFGNFKEAYTIIDRVGIRTLRDPFTAAPYVKFRTTKRVGGDVTNFEALKFIKFASS